MWRFENSYIALPEILFERSRPVPVACPRLVVWNEALAEELGLGGIEPDPEIFGGNRLPPGAEPIAQAYAGHQFGHFTMLGDGRALLLGEQMDPRGRRWDIQLKGSGQTRFSRGGDGRAALGPMLREYIIGEALHGLGIPCTRALAVCATGEPVYREKPLPGAVLTRVASSHIRVGTFEYAAAFTNHTTLSALAHFTLQRHFPEKANAPSCPALALLSCVVESQAALIAKWMLVGFVHGVMNTDNMALSGESIDFGPCAFLDRYDPETVFSSIDRQGRYAFGNQPDIAFWNLHRFAECLLPLLDTDPNRAVEAAQTALSVFPDRFRHHWSSGMRAKLGLCNVEEDDAALIGDFLDQLQAEGRDFTLSFAALDPLAPARTEWERRWQARLDRQPLSRHEAARNLRAVNPVFIPRNHKVEEALAAAQDGNLSPLERLVSALRSPFDRERIGCDDLKQPAPADSPPYRTFCGT